MKGLKTDENQITENAKFLKNCLFFCDLKKYFNVHDHER